jgi:hypothetical protein
VLSAGGTVQQAVAASVSESRPLRVADDGHGSVVEEAVAVGTGTGAEVGVLSGAVTASGATAAEARRTLSARAAVGTAVARTARVVRITEVPVLPAAAVRRLEIPISAGTAGETPLPGAAGGWVSIRRVPRLLDQHGEEGLRLGRRGQRSMLIE